MAYGYSGAAGGALGLGHELADLVIFFDKGAPLENMLGLVFVAHEVFLFKCAQLSYLLSLLHLLVPPFPVPSL